jgi:hypothetical protein
MITAAAKMIRDTGICIDGHIMSVWAGIVNLALPFRRNVVVITAGVYRADGRLPSPLAIGNIPAGHVQERQMPT